MAKKKFYFGNGIKPACSYCIFGSSSKEGSKVFCEKQGLVDSDSNCKKWVYDPLKRIPQKQMNMPNNDDDYI